MQFTQSIAHLFTTARDGRRLSVTRAPTAGHQLEPGASKAAGEAAIYVRGLLEAGAGERNLEDIAATVPGADHQRVHHFVSNVAWDEAKVLDWVSARADGLLGGTPQSFLIADESGFSKKGNSSSAVARQYNGRLGKVDNCQVGVFTALAAGSRVTLLEGRLYLPAAWADDAARCEKAKIPPEKQVYKSKAQIAREMIRAQRQRGVRFAWTSLDAGYGKDPALLRGLDADGETFVADIHAPQRLWSEHPWPALPLTTHSRARGQPASRLRPAVPGQEVRAWAAARPAEEWIPFKRRDGIHGPLRGSFLHARVWLWDGTEEEPRHWHLIVWRPGETPDKIKYVLSNAPADTPALDLARMAASRYWVERALQDAKSSAGMGEYQLRSWVGWHHHMALVMLAMLFMLQQRLLLAEELPLLSTEDIVWVLEHYLPRPHTSEAEIQAALARRHRRREADILSRKRRNPAILEDLL